MLIWFESVELLEVKIYIVYCMALLVSESLISFVARRNMNISRINHEHQRYQKT